MLEYVSLGCRNYNRLFNVCKGVNYGICRRCYYTGNYDRCFSNGNLRLILKCNGNDVVLKYVSLGCRNYNRLFNVCEGVNYRICRRCYYTGDNYRCFCNGNLRLILECNGNNVVLEYVSLGCRNFDRFFCPNLNIGDRCRG